MGMVLNAPYTFRLGLVALLCVVQQNLRILHLSAVFHCGSEGLTAPGHLVGPISCSGSQMRNYLGTSAGNYAFSNQ